jgi:hypothetical protein
MLLALALMTFFGTEAVRADDAKKAKDEDDEVQKEMSRYANGAPGVANVEKDEHGELQYLIVVGQARISTVLGKGKGLEIAKQRAAAAAKGAFLQWLKENAKLYERSEDGTINIRVVEKEDAKKKDTEVSKGVEVTERKFESAAQGLIRAMQSVHGEVTDKGETWAVVMVFDAADAKAAKKVAKDLKASGGDGMEKPGKPDAKAGAKEGKDEDKVEEKKVTSPAARKYVKRKK